jgi:hypothetical protein
MCASSASSYTPAQDAIHATKSPQMVFSDCETFRSSHNLQLELCGAVCQEGFAACDGCLQEIDLIRHNCFGANGKRSLLDDDETNAVDFYTLEPLPNIPDTIDINAPHSDGIATPPSQVIRTRSAIIGADGQSSSTKLLPLRWIASLTISLVLMRFLLFK